MSETTVDDPASPTPAGRALRVGRRSYPVILPSLRDPRLHLASVVITLQVLGQTVLDFDLSIAQILLSLGTCAVLEFAITFGRRRVIAWPASALLTGNGVAFILRVPGTEHGDWWSTKGWWIFVGTSAISLLSKYVIRTRGRHVFNPSNIGLVLCFLALGENRADPQDLWWGPMSWGLALTWAVIAIGGTSIVIRMRMVGMAIAYWVTLAVTIGVIALGTHSITARWSVDAVSGSEFWWVVVGSPEIFVFMFGMITDPRTAPLGRVARVLYGAAIALVGGLLAAPQRTEFGTKVAILGALVAVTALVPFLEHRLPARDSERDRLRVWLAGLRPARWGIAVGGAAAMVPALLLLGINSRSVTRIDAVDAALVADRPSVGADVVVPPITVDPEVTKLAPKVNAAEAKVMAKDLVQCLAIMGDARIARDADLAVTVATGKWLKQFDADITAAQTAGEIVVRSYEFDSMRVVLVRDPKRPQLPPKLGVATKGTVTSATYADGDTEPSDETEAPYEGTFVLVAAGEGYVVAAESA